MSKDRSKKGTRNSQLTLMLRNRIYYGLKPLIPRTIRMEVRRRIALRTRKRATGVWPIMPGSEQRPPHWPGWPDGKKFAFVLTHDVESTAGLEKCRDLMQLEMDLGFRSSFNFVPEGELHRILASCERN